MTVMTNESLKETAATADESRTRERRSGARLASGEFFYLVERIDRLDEKVNRRIDALDEKLTGKIESEVKTINGRIDALDEKVNRRIDALDSKIEERIDKLDTKLTSKIESEVKSLSDKFTTTQQWMIGLIVAMLVGAGAIVISLLYH